MSIFQDSAIVLNSSFFEDPSLRLPLCLDAFITFPPMYLPNVSKQVIPPRECDCAIFKGAFLSSNLSMICQMMAF